MNDGNISSATELTLLHFCVPREITVSAATENDYLELIVNNVYYKKADKITR